MIDFVGNHANTERTGRIDDRLQFRLGNHCARWIGRACKQYTLQWLFGVGSGQSFGSQSRRCAVAGRYFHHFQTKRRQNIAIGRIAGTRDRHAVARIEIDHESQIEGCRRTSRHGYSIRRNGHAVMIGIMRGNCLTQFNQPKSVGIADAAVFQCLLGRLSHDLRRRICGLAHRHGNNRMTCGAAAVCLCQNIHGVEWLYRTAT
jgi:hypothetical protein